MIKINLLGAAAPKAKVAAVEPATKPVQLWSLIGALGLSFGIVGLLYLLWSSSIASLKVELKKQQVEQARLAVIKQENIKFELERRLLEERINTIQILQTSRVGPAEFMNALGNVINKTPNDLFLSSVAPQGDRVVIHGQATSANSVAALLTFLRTSGYFDDVQLRQFYEDDVQEQISYKFNMDCTSKQAMAPVSPAQTAGGAGGATPPRRAGS